MALHTLAIDIGKHSFHVFGVGEDGIVVSRKVSRVRLAATVDHLDPKVIAMEACGSAHHWGRLFEAAGRTVRLINAYFVRLFVRGSKNDTTDAQAIWDAAGRPTMRFVPVKSLACQDLQALHRVRDRLVHSRTALINHTRGLLAEYGVVLPQGAKRFTAQVSQAVAEAEASLSELARELFAELQDQLADVDERIARIDARLVAICRENSACRRLVSMPGVGSVVATALVAAVNDGRQFRSGRDLATWIGLVPRQYTTGGKPKLGGIGRRANHYLRRQIVHGARAVLSQAGRRSDPRAEWMKGVAARRGFNRAVIAVANKMARAAWAMGVARGGVRGSLSRARKAGADRAEPMRGG